MQYIVPVVYKGQTNFLVEADSVDEARSKAEESYRECLPNCLLGNEWETIDKVGRPVIVGEPLDVM